MNDLSFYDSLFMTLVLVSLEFFLGFVYLKSNGPSWASWAFPGIAVVVTHLVCIGQPPPFRLVALVVVLFAGMKIVMARHYPKLSFNLKKWALYCFGWIGMNPETFFKSKSSPDYQLLRKGLGYLISGTAILFGIKFIVNPTANPTGVTYYILSLLLLVGLSQLLHFGILNINAYLLQVAGYPAYTLFRAPLEAKSLGDFWGKRWNIPFTEMTSVTVYRPLLCKWGESPAFLFSFVFSGILHEVALSLPVNTGFGLPMLYFCLQLLLTMAERKIFHQRKPGVVWVLGCLVIPLPILFHSSIMNGVFWKIFL